MKELLLGKAEAYSMRKIPSTAASVILYPTEQRVCLKKVQFFSGDILHVKQENVSCGCEELLFRFRWDQFPFFYILIKSLTLIHLHTFDSSAKINMLFIPQWYIYLCALLLEASASVSFSIRSDIRYTTYCNCNSHFI